MFSLIVLSIIAATAAAGRVVVVRSGDAQPYLQAEQALVERLGGLGHSTRRLGMGSIKSEGVSSIVDREPDAVVAVGTSAAVWLQKRLPAGPVLTGCFVAANASRFRSDRSLTALSTRVSVEDQFALIDQAVTGVSRVGALYRSNEARSRLFIQQAEAALPRGWRLEAIDVDAHDSVAGAIDALLKKNVDVIWTAPDSTVYGRASVRALLLAALRSRTPVFGYSPGFVKAGALLGIGIDPAVQGRAAADLTDRLMKEGKRATSEVSIHKARDFQIAVNRIVADKLDIDLPDRLIERADSVFE